jgi:hypothetical protein
LQFVCIELVVVPQYSVAGRARRALKSDIIYVCRVVYHAHLNAEMRAQIEIKRVLRADLLIDNSARRNFLAFADGVTRVGAEQTSMMTFLRTVVAVGYPRAHT